MKKFKQKLFKLLFKGYMLVPIKDVEYLEQARKDILKDTDVHTYIWISNFSMAAWTLTHRKYLGHNYER